MVGTGGGEMTQTMSAHVNKWKKRKRENLSQKSAGGVA
jgi:hypothetical protein